MKMRNLGIGAVFSVITTASFLSGCLGDLKVAPAGSGGAGGANGSTSSSGSAGSTSASSSSGGTEPCMPASTMPCDTGAPGACGQGTKTCNANGMGYGVCQPVNATGFDDCKTAADEDCDGMAISQCTGAIDWTVTRAGALQAPMDDQVFGTAATKNNEYVITGVVDGSINVGLTINAGKLLVAKYDNTGALAWENVYTSTGLAGGRDVVVDSQGNVIVVGDFQGTLTMGMNVLPSISGSTDIFLAKFNPQGQIIWVKSYGSTGGDTGRGVVVDANDNIVMTGWAHGSDIDLGSGKVNLTGDELIVLKVDPNASHLWDQIPNNGGDQQGESVAVAKNGDVIIGGESNANFSFGAAMHTVSAGYDGFVARFSGSTGKCSWSRSMAGNGDQEARDVVVALNDNPVVLGKFVNGIDFGNGNVLMANGSVNGFLAEFNAQDSTIVRSVGFGDAGTYPRSLGIDGAGHIYLEGTYAGGVAFGAMMITSTNQFDAFTAKLDAMTWDPLWLHSIGKLGNQYGTAISVDSLGRAIIGGTFDDELDGAAPSDTLHTTGAFDLFVRRLAP